MGCQLSLRDSKRSPSLLRPAAHPIKRPASTHRNAGARERRHPEEPSACELLENSIVGCRRQPHRLPRLNRGFTKQVFNNLNYSAFLGITKENRYEGRALSREMSSNTARRPHWRGYRACPRPAVGVLASPLVPVRFYSAPGRVAGIRRGGESRRWRQGSARPASACNLPSARLKVYGSVVDHVFDAGGPVFENPDPPHGSSLGVGAPDRSLKCINRIHLWPSRRSGTDDRVPEERGEKSNHNNAKNKTLLPLPIG
jgi:hypothetical protein